MKEQSKNYWDGKGEPEVGQEVMFTENASSSTRYKSFNGRVVTIVGKFKIGSVDGFVISDLLIGHESITSWELFIKPIKSEREIAIEEMQEDIINYQKSSTESLSMFLYDAGYRKVEVK